MPRRSCDIILLTNINASYDCAVVEDITVYPKKYAHGFVVLCFVVVMQSFIMNSHEVFIHIHQGCFAGTGAIVRLPQCQWSKPDGYGKISQCITTTKHSKAKTVCIFLGIYCTCGNTLWFYDGFDQIIICSQHKSYKSLSLDLNSFLILTIMKHYPRNYRYQREQIKI